MLATLRRPAPSAPCTTTPVLSASPPHAAGAQPRRSWRIPPRMHAFEFCDQPWLRGVWREAYLDGLNFLFRLGGIYRNMHKPFGRWARQAGRAHVLDLGSGGAGPIVTLLAAARRDAAPLPQITLSDLYPDLSAFERVKSEFPGQVDYIATPLDAFAEGNAGSEAPLRSICTGFHHLTPEQARRFLAAVTARTDGLFIMEPMPRTWLSPLMSLLTLPLLMLAPFFAHRFSLKKLALSTLLPLVPLMIVFDGVVSALRMYHPDELLVLLPESARKQWRWEWGTQRCLLVHKATYLFGYRIRKEGSA